MLRPEFVRRKLQLITDELQHLAEFRDVGYDQFIADPVRVAAVERMLERIIIRAVDVNEHILASGVTPLPERTTRLSYRATFERLGEAGVLEPGFAGQVATSAGLRNIIVHEYNDVDHRIVHAAIRGCLEDYVTYVRSVTDWLDRRDNAPQ